MLRIPYLLDNRLTDGDEVVSLTRRPYSVPHKHFLVLISVEAESTPRAIVRLEVLGPFKKEIQ
jgi:hypothetical protein